MQHVVGDQPEQNHDSVDQVLGGWAAVLLPAHGGDDEEDRQPDDELIPHEHPSRTQQQRNETGSIWLFLQQESGRVEVLHIV